jgi:hypothetical protein
MCWLGRAFFPLFADSDFCCGSNEIGSSADAAARFNGTQLIVTRK